MVEINIFEKETNTFLNPKSPTLRQKKKSRAKNSKSKLILKAKTKLKILISAKLVKPKVFSKIWTRKLSETEEILTKKKQRKALTNIKKREIKVGVKESFKLKNPLKIIGAKHWAAVLKKYRPKQAAVISTAVPWKAPVWKIILTIGFLKRNIKTPTGKEKYKTEENTILNLSKNSSFLLATHSLDKAGKAAVAKGMPITPMGRYLKLLERLKTEIAPSPIPEAIKVIIIKLNWTEEEEIILGPIIKKKSLIALWLKEKIAWYLKPLFLAPGNWTKKWRKEPKTTPKPAPKIPQCGERKTMPKIIPKL